jgi:hypothetical protein
MFPSSPLAPQSQFKRRLATTVIMALKMIQMPVWFDLMKILDSSRESLYLQEYHALLSIS